MNFEYSLQPQIMTSRFRWDLRSRFQTFEEFLANESRIHTRTFFGIENSDQRLTNGSYISRNWIGQSMNHTCSAIRLADILTVSSGAVVLYPLSMLSIDNNESHECHSHCYWCCSFCWYSTYRNLDESICEGRTSLHLQKLASLSWISQITAI